MDGASDQLIRSASKRLKGKERRLFQGEVCCELCGGSPRKAEYRFCWSREAVQRGIDELNGNVIDAEPKQRRGHRKRSEEKNPQLAIDIQMIVDPHTYCDPELKSERIYTNKTAAEVRQELIKFGYEEAQVPAERTIRDILNRMNYRLKRIQKAKPIKKTKDTDAIFDNVHQRREQYKDDSETLEISVDTKAKVSLGEYSQGGKTRTDSHGNLPKALDHDPPAQKN